MDITIPNIPLSLEQALIARATAEKKSMVETLVDAAARDLGVELPKHLLGKPTECGDPPGIAGIDQATESAEQTRASSDVGKNERPPKRRDLSFLAGTWIPDPEFDAILEEQRRIDPELWK